MKWGLSCRNMPSSLRFGGRKRRCDPAAHRPLETCNRTQALDSLPSALRQILKLVHKTGAGPSELVQGSQHGAVPRDSHEAGEGSGQGPRRCAVGLRDSSWVLVRSHSPQGWVQEGARPWVSSLPVPGDVTTSSASPQYVPVLARSVRS